MIMVASRLLLSVAAARAYTITRPARTVVTELLPLLNEGGTRPKDKNASTVAQIDAAFDALSAAGLGKDLLSDEVFGNYEVSYFSGSVDGGRDGGRDGGEALTRTTAGRKARTVPRAVSWLPRQVLRRAFALDATYQHVVRPKTLVNHVRFRFLGFPAAVVARASFERLPAEDVAAIAAANGTALTNETIHVDFDAPRLSFGRRGRLNFEIAGPSAQPPVDLCTPYVDDRVRLGLASRGGKFVFVRTDAAASATDWAARLDRAPVSGRRYLVATAAALVAAAVAPLPTAVAAPLAVAASTRLVVSRAS